MWRQDPKPPRSEAHRKLGIALRRSRLAAHLSLDQIAASIHLSKSSCSRHENGLTTPGVEEVRLWAEACSVQSTVLEKLLDRARQADRKLTLSRWDHHELDVGRYEDEGTGPAFTEDPPAASIQRDRDVMDHVVAMTAMIREASVEELYEIATTVHDALRFPNWVVTQVMSALKQRIHAMDEASAAAALVLRVLSDGELPDDDTFEELMPRLDLSQDPGPYALLALELAERPCAALTRRLLNTMTPPDTGEMAWIWSMWLATNGHAPTLRPRLRTMWKWAQCQTTADVWWSLVAAIDRALVGLSQEQAEELVSGALWTDIVSDLASIPDERYTLAPALMEGGMTHRDLVITQWQQVLNLIFHFRPAGWEQAMSGTLTAVLSRAESLPTHGLATCLGLTDGLDFDVRLLALEAGVTRLEQEPALTSSGQLAQEAIRVYTQLASEVPHQVAIATSPTTVESNKDLLELMRKLGPDDPIEYISADNETQRRPHPVLERLLRNGQRITQWYETVRAADPPQLSKADTD